jgi:hypothetical protein
MTDMPSDHLTVELTMAEAKLLVAALRQFEPYWPDDMDDMSRAELLSGLRHEIEHLARQLDPEQTPSS